MSAGPAAQAGAVFRSVTPGNAKICRNRQAQTLSGGDATGENFSFVTRDDGSKQVAYKGMPLYLWVRDEKPGDTTGEGVGNVWLVARP